MAKRSLGDIDFRNCVSFFITIGVTNVSRYSKSALISLGKFLN
ncbi:unnamed protein product [Acanthoscelides obtectus]|uniref:Uncharacterized protein n=1 Tax=Acanthoscelides obtectus TaxID=200917 RepID=A0A9P0LZV5_ACAOB|nr:unnamed protein product [Acanthoscelides obtectus]CAK1670175.1 hypothetical protein AOBTE_LOCUS27449 [Acanthoscelides obtectus]